MNVADWLRTLGLEPYEALFRQNDIDSELLPGEAKERGIVGETPILPRACKALQSPTPWSLRKARESSSAICSSLRT
jgi:hypothetical protein